VATIGLVAAVFAPLMALVSIYLLAGLFHLALVVLRGAPRGFETTVTVVGYAYGLYLINALPMCGGLIAMVWFAVAVISGLAAAQRTTTWKATLAASSPALLLCLCACAAAAAIPGWMHTLQGGGGPTSL